MVRCFPCDLEFGQSKNMFYGISTFLNMTFAELPGGKSADPGEYNCFYISPLKSLNLVFIPSATLDDYRGIWTGCTGNFERFQYFELETNFLKNENFFQKTRALFFS